MSYLDFDGALKVKLFDSETGNVNGFLEEHRSKIMEIKFLPASMRGCATICIVYTE